MSKKLIYQYRDFMLEDDFPFDFRIRNNANIDGEHHAHDHLQICYVNKGKCLHTVGNKDLILVKGDVFSIPPFFEHSISIFDDLEVELFQIDFMPYFINENMRDLNKIEGFVDFAYIQPLLLTDDGALLTKLNFSQKCRLIIEEIIANMRDELEKKEEGFKLSVKAYLLQLLVLIGRENKKFFSGRQEKEIIHVHREKFFAVISYVNEHYDEKFKLEEMAEKVAMSASYFSNMFKLIFGKTFTDYTNEVRINKAMEALKYTNESVTQIYLESGFNHLGHFNRMFKRLTGITPTEYRKQSRSIQ